MHRSIVQAHEHHALVPSLLDELLYGAPLQTAPLVSFVVCTEKHDDEFTLVALDFLEALPHPGTARGGFV